MGQRHARYVHWNYQGSHRPVFSKRGFDTVFLRYTVTTLKNEMSRFNQMAFDMPFDWTRTRCKPTPPIILEDWES